MIEQTLVLAGAAVVLAVTLVRIRFEADAGRVSCVLLEEERGLLLTPTHARNKRTARALLIIAARELADAVEEGSVWRAQAWAVRAAHLGRKVNETDARRGRYQRQGQYRRGPSSVVSGLTQRLEDTRVAVTA